MKFLKPILFSILALGLLSLQAEARDRHHHRHHNHGYWYAAPAAVAGFWAGYLITRPTPAPLPTPAQCWVQTGPFYGQGYYTECR